MNRSKPRGKRIRELRAEASKHREKAENLLEFVRNRPENDGPSIRQRIRKERRLAMQKHLEMKRLIVEDLQQAAGNTSWR